MPEDTILPTKDEWIADNTHGGFDVPMKHYEREAVEVIVRNCPDIRFMLSPSVIVDGQSIPARTCATPDLSSFIDYVKENQGKVILREISFMPSIPIFTEIDPINFTRTSLDVPIMSEATWKIRFATCQ